MITESAVTRKKLSRVATRVRDRIVNKLVNNWLPNESYLGKYVSHEVIWDELHQVTGALVTMKLNGGEEYQVLVNVHVVEDIWQ